MNTGNDHIAMGARDALIRAMQAYFGNIELVRPFSHGHFP